MSVLRRRVFGASVVLALWGLASYYAIRSHHDAPFVAAAKRFGLSDRVMTLEEVTLVADGGTISVSLATRSGSLLVVCLDGRMREFNPGEEAPVRKVFVGAAYPEDEGAVALVPASEDEQALLFILSSIEVPPEAPSGFLEKIICVLDARNSVG